MCRPLRIGFWWFSALYIDVGVWDRKLMPRLHCSEFSIAQRASADHRPTRRCSRESGYVDGKLTLQEVCSATRPARAAAPAWVRCKPWWSSPSAKLLCRRRPQGHLSQRAAARRRSCLRAPEEAGGWWSGGVVPFPGVGAIQERPGTRAGNPEAPPGHRVTGRPHRTSPGLQSPPRGLSSLD